MKRFWGVILCAFCISWTGITETLAQKVIHSIVKETRTEVECTSMTQYVEKNTMEITVFDREGEEDAAFVCFCDQFVSLESFSGEIFDIQGKRVRKIRKSDLQISEYSSSLLTDDYRYYYLSKHPSFPYTIRYEWKVKCRDGVIGFPLFVPQVASGQPVVKASYSIRIPAGQTCRYYARNIEGKKVSISEKADESGWRQIDVVASDLPPLYKEQAAPSWNKLLPMVYFVPSDFVYDGVEGNLNSWKDYGAWQYKLLKGREVLDEAFRKRLHGLVADCRTEREKVKAVYDYLAETTRYVSIQLGIGGLQPAAASDVCRLGFGDCKGLSNYMLAMLKELGIPSTYVVVSTENERLIPDFATANQMNHVVLQVPLPGDTLWLECTNAHLPFGYIHSRIAGHDALLIEPSGGRLCRIPDYQDSLHTKVICADIRLGATGEADVRVNETSWLARYEEIASIVSAAPDQQKQKVRSRVKLPRVEVEDWSISERKEAAPSVGIDYTVRVEKYGNQTGSRLFVPVNVFREVPDYSSKQERTYPIYIGHGYVDRDSLHISFPEGYEVEAVPASVSFDSPYGEFRSEIKVKGREVYVVQQLAIRKGTYSTDTYAEFVRFWKQVAGQYGGKLVLRKSP